MDIQSLNKLRGKNVNLTLVNGFWYRAKILSVSENAVEFMDKKGKHISVLPEAILIIGELENDCI